jgi:hypothetical protein
VSKPGSIFSIFLSILLLLLLLDAYKHTNANPCIPLTQASAQENQIMAGGSSSRDELTAASVLSTRELAALHLHHQHQQEQGAAAIDDVEAAATGRKQQRHDSGGGGGGVSRAYVRGLWFALGLALLALAGSVGFQLYVLRERVRFSGRSCLPS